MDDESPVVREFVIHFSPKEAALSFKDNLTQIIDRIEGSAAAAILGIDGLVIERYTKDLDPSLDLELIAIEFTNLLRRSMHTASDTELGDLREMVVATDRLTFLLRPITAEYF
ncbi:MAG: roadblock/LC7 domain-containing protein, partial [Acidobacteriota bacterium]